MKRSVIFLSIMVLIGFVFFTGSASADDKWANLVEESGRVLSEIQKMPDNGVPEDLMDKCSAIAIFPSSVSAGFVIGGKYGQGIIMVRDEKKGLWSPPAIFTMAGASFGFQIGGQATDIVLLIMNRRSVDGILQGKCKLGVDADVAAGPVGRSAEASTDIQLKGGILSYSRGRGLFAGAKLEGAVLAQHWEGDYRLYGKELSAREILIEGKAKMPKSANEVLKILEKYPYKR